MGGGWFEVSRQKTLFQEGGVNSVKLRDPSVLVTDVEWGLNVWYVDVV